MKKNMLALLIIFNVLIGLSLIVTSYAYIYALVKGNDNSKIIIYKNNPLTINYTDNNNVIANDNSFTPGSTITKSFRVSNNTEADFSFSLVLKNVLNTFNRKDDITYSLSLNGNVIKTGIFPDEDTTLVYQQDINSNEYLDYVITIYYINSIENQIEDSGSTINSTIEFGYANGIDNIIIYGNSVQLGTPSSNNPIPIYSVGNLIDDPINQNYGKYLIQFGINGEYTDIYLDEPLRKVGNYVDYIDFKNKKVVRNVEEIDNTGTLPISDSLRGLSNSIETSIDLPNLSVIPGNGIISINTIVEPSSVNVVD